jgi:hypothetical protein
VPQLPAFETGDAGLIAERASSECRCIGEWSAGEFRFLADFFIQQTADDKLEVVLSGNIPK